MIIHHRLVQVQRQVILSISGIERTPGQGDFEIEPQSLEIIWSHMDDDPPVVISVTVRGVRLDLGRNDHPTGLAKYWPNSYQEMSDLPEWIRTAIDREESLR